MGLVWFGAVLNKMGKVRVLYRKPQPNTTTHNNQHEPQPPYPPAALPSLSPWAEQSCPQIILQLLPNKCAQVASRQARARCHWFARLGGGKMRGIKKRERGVCLGLRWPPFQMFKQQSNGWWVDVRGCVGEEVRLGWNVWGGRLPLCLGGRINRQKK